MPATGDINQERHEANLKRFEGLERETKQQTEILIRIDERTKAIPEMEARIKTLELDKARQTGIIAVLSVLGGAISAGVVAGLTWLIEHFWGK